MAGSPTYAAAPSTGQDKVSSAERAASSASDKITFWVTFHAKAPLGVAMAKTTKAEKGAEVRRLLLDTATTSQAGVRNLLDNTDADYQSFWIANRIMVTGSSKLLDALAERAEVATIEELKTYKLPEFTPAAANAGPQAVEWGVDRINAPRVWTELGTRGEGIDGAEGSHCRVQSVLAATRRNAIELQYVRPRAGDRYSCRGRRAHY
jgi:hypothetical protein